MSMPIELMLLAVNSNFLVFSISSDDMMGQSFASLVPMVAAAESAIGLAIFVITFRVRGTIVVESINSIQVVPPESNEQQRLLRISLRICGTIVESLPMARSAPKCEKTVQALLCQNLNVKPATLPNAISSRRIRLQDDLVTAMAIHLSLWVAPLDLQQGGNSRIPYVHVPMARMSILVYIATAINTLSLTLAHFPHRVPLCSSWGCWDKGGFETRGTKLIHGHRDVYVEREPNLKSHWFSRSENEVNNSDGKQILFSGFALSSQAPVSFWVPKGRVLQHRLGYGIEFECLLQCMSSLLALIPKGTRPLSVIPPNNYLGLVVQNGSLDQFSCKQAGDFRRETVNFRKQAHPLPSGGYLLDLMGSSSSIQASRPLNLLNWAASSPSAGRLPSFPCLAGYLKPAFEPTKPSRAAIVLLALARTASVTDELTYTEGGLNSIAISCSICDLRHPYYCSL
ncbi:ATPase subunit 4 [Tanacetum coccineum]